MVLSDNFLVSHAYKHVWCGPGQDRQHILAPTRITPIRGATWSVVIGMSQYSLPVQGIKYDVFVFGDVLPSELGMDSRYETWISAKAHCEARDLMIHLYNRYGVHYPLEKAYLMYTRSGNLVLALTRLPKMSNYAIEQIYVRWRSASYFSVQPGDVNLGVKIGYFVFMSNNAAYQTFRHSWLTVKALTYGKAFAYVNGYRVRDYALPNLTPGDHLEWIFDGDIKEVIELLYKDLMSFESDLDNARKLLIPRHGLGVEIDFVDDMDFYILNYKKPAEYKGIYYHQNRVDAIRMVTHRDYALHAQYVSSAMVDQTWASSDDIRVEVIVRYSGFNRGLVNEHHRIQELYKLTDDARVNAMIGSNSGVAVWAASALESSFYLTLMRTKVGEVTPGLVIDAYGYNAVSRLTGLVPIQVPANATFVDLFYGQYVHSTVYEYDTVGKLIGWYRHTQQRQYAIRNPECRYIEAYAGAGGVGMSTVYNNHLDPTPFTFDSHKNYRVYVGRLLGTGQLGEWEDVTNNVNYYTVVDKVINWEVMPLGTVTAIRNDLDYLSKDLYLSSSDGVLIFTVGTDEVYPGKSNIYDIMEIPPGEYDIFINGYDGVEGIDYYCNWPEFCIISNRYWDSESPVQKITIRARGFCKQDLSFDQPGDRGFVIHNQLSRNGHYNLRDDRVTRISIGGVLYTMEEVGFAEDGTFINHVPNGTPYRITHPYIPMLDLVPGDTYDYRALSMVVDMEIEGYMDVYNPEPEITTPNPIPHRYHVVSSFSSKVIEDILTGFISMDEFKGNYSQQAVSDRLQGYTYLLAYDPVLREPREDLFTFLPHRHSTVALSLYEFRFIKRMIDVFLEGKIELNRYATVVEKEEP